MSHKLQLFTYRTHLEKRYRVLVERSNDYRYEDETISDTASFKALKVLAKINQIRFLEGDLSNTLV